MSTHAQPGEQGVRTDGDLMTETGKVHGEDVTPGAAGEEMDLYEKPHGSRDIFIYKQKRVEQTHKSSRAVPDQKGVGEWGTKLEPGGATKENPQHKEGAEREREREAREHLDFGKTHLSTATSLSRTL